jgi:membrane dipeptidase
LFLLSSDGHGTAFRSRHGAAIIAVLSTVFVAACSKEASDGVPPTTEELALHGRTLTLDTHVDIPPEFATDTFDPLTADAQANLEKLRAGGLDAAFFIVYVPQTARTPEGYAEARDAAETKFAGIRRMTDTLYPELIELAHSPGDVERIAASGKLVAAIGVENGFSFGIDLDLLDEYYARGARYVGLVHNGHNDLAHSAQPNAELGDRPLAESDGVTALGARAIERMNRLGIMVDISHASKRSALDAIRLSAAPVIASHSSMHALVDHPRNLDDETLRALAASGGVAQIVAYDIYIASDPPADIADLIDHVDHAVALVGIDHVGLSSDFGGGGGVVGWSDASETANVTRELAARGYGAAEIEKLWSGNLRRVWRDVERVARALEGSAPRGIGQ